MANSAKFASLFIALHVSGMEVYQFNVIQKKKKKINETKIFSQQ